MIPSQGQRRLEKGLDRDGQELHGIVRAVLVEHGLAAEHLRDLSLADFDPALGRRIVESQRNAIEARLLQVEKMGELVEPDVVRVVGISETLAQGRHRQDHGAPGVRLTGKVIDAKLVVPVEVIWVEQDLGELLPVVGGPTERQCHGRSRDQEAELVNDLDPDAGDRLFRQEDSQVVLET